MRRHCRFAYCILHTNQDDDGEENAEEEEEEATNKFKLKMCQRHLKCNKTISTFIINNLFFI